MNPSKTDFLDLLLYFSKGTIDKLTSCDKADLKIYLLEHQIGHGFKASRLLFSQAVLQDFEHLNSYYFDVFTKWIRN